MTQVLYGALAGPLTTSDLYTIDPATAVLTSIGPVGYAVTGLAFDPTDGTLYGVTSNNSAASPRSLISIDPDTGAGTLIGSLGSSNCADICCDSAGNLFGWAEGPDDLASIDKGTGLATVVGDAGQSTFGDGESFDSSDVLYDMSKGSSGALWTVDTSTGAVTAVATLSGDPTGGGNAIGAAAFDSADVLWAVVNGSTGNYHLVTVATDTGVITDVALTMDHLDAIAWSSGAPATPGVHAHGIPTGEAHGHPTITQIATLNVGAQGIPPSSGVGTPTITDAGVYTIYPPGIP